MDGHWLARRAANQWVVVTVRRLVRDIYLDRENIGGFRSLLGGFYTELARVPKNLSEIRPTSGCKQLI
jgi:hypothetical protein